VTLELSVVLVADVLDADRDWIRFCRSLESAPALPEDAQDPVVALLVLDVLMPVSELSDEVVALEACACRAA